MRIDFVGFMRFITTQVSFETLSRLFLPVERYQSRRS